MTPARPAPQRVAQRLRSLPHLFIHSRISQDNPGTLIPVVGVKIMIKIIIIITTITMVIYIFFTVFQALF